MRNPFASRRSQALRHNSERKPRVVCAWCNRELTEGEPGGLTSHGVCADCAFRYLELDM